MDKQKYESGKKAKSKSVYPYSGLKKEEERLVKKLLNSVELLSLIHEDCYKNCNLSNLSDKDKIVFLLNELQFLREFLRTTVIYCHAIGDLQEEQIQKKSSGGRKSKDEEKRILIKIIVEYFKEKSDFPTGATLHSLFKEYIAPMNDTRRKNFDSKILTASERLASLTLKEVREIW